jgi:hypothetical protein
MLFGITHLVMKTEAMMFNLEQRPFQLHRYQREQLSRHRKTKQNADVSPCEQISILVSFIMLPAEEVRRVNQLPLTSEEKHMETILIVLLVLFLLGGGGWGYSRWRGN